MFNGRMKRNCFKPSWQRGKSTSDAVLSWGCSSLYIRNNTQWDYSSKTILELPDTALGSLPRPSKDVDCQLFTTIDSIAQDWDLLASQSGNIFLKRSYLKALESAPPQGMRFGYILVLYAGVPAGIAVCQIKHFRASDSIQFDDTSKTEPCFFDGLTEWFKKRVAGWVDADILVIGNLLVSGQHGYWVDETRLDAGTFIKGIVANLPEISSFFEDHHSKIDLLLFKDVSKSHQTLFSSVLTSDQFVAFEIQPSMELDFPSTDFQGYLSSMSTKYRTRAKRAFKKAESLERRVIDREALVRYESRMFELYEQVVNNAGFNVVDLHPKYNASIANQLGGEVQVSGYFDGEELLAFFSTIKNGSTLEAHFVGYEKTRNHEFQLYLNMLYDMIRLAFELGCTRISFARTALEIKSSVGATPHDYACYLRHRNPYVNKLTGSILEYLKPVEQWVQRHPFKHSEPSDE